MRALLSTVALLLGLALMAGCGRSLPQAYETALEDWTREQRSWENMESRIHVRATLKTASFRAAYVVAYADLFDLDASARSELMSAEEAEGARDYVILVALYTPEPSWSRLSPQYGVWEVRLQSESGRVERPRAVRNLNTNNPTWKRLLPKLSPHESLFALHFSRTNEEGLPLATPGETVELVIAGAPAKVRLSWKLP
jgi:hypothetical protein